MTGNAFQSSNRKYACFNLLNSCFWPETLKIKHIVIRCINGVLLFAVLIFKGVLMDNIQPSIQYFRFLGPLILITCTCKTKKESHSVPSSIPKSNSQDKTHTISKVANKLHTTILNKLWTITVKREKAIIHCTSHVMYWEFQGSPLVVVLLSQLRVETFCLTFCRCLMSVQVTLAGQKHHVKSWRKQIIHVKICRYPSEALHMYKYCILELILIWVAMKSVKNIFTGCQKIV